MNSEKIIHLQLEYPEAIKIKKEILLTEAGFIKVLGRMKEFHSMRKEELKNKKKINLSIKNINSNLGKIKVLMPKIEKPKILKGMKNQKQIFPEEKIKIKHYKNDLEKDLEDIRNRLRMLDEKF